MYYFIDEMQFILKLLKRANNQTRMCNTQDELYK